MNRNIPYKLAIGTCFINDSTINNKNVKNLENKKITDKIGVKNMLSPSSNDTIRVVNLCSLLKRKKNSLN
jgi:hypothetical protein